MVAIIFSSTVPTIHALLITAKKNDPFKQSLQIINKSQNEKKIFIILKTSIKGKITHFVLVQNVYFFLRSNYIALLLT